MYLFIYIHGYVKSVFVAENRKLFSLLLALLCLATVLLWLLIGLAVLGCWTFSCFPLSCAFPLFCYGFSLALLCLHVLPLVHPLCFPTVLLWLLSGLASLGRCTFFCFSIVSACLLFVLVFVWHCIAWSLHSLPASSSLSMNLETMYLNWPGDVVV